jgi:hypothetical protein
LPSDSDCRAQFGQTKFRKVIGVFLSESRFSALKRYRYRAQDSFVWESFALVKAHHYLVDERSNVIVRQLASLQSLPDFGNFR